MITAFVEFKLPEPITLAEAKATFLSTAPKYQGMPGLIRKTYYLSEDGAKAGGIYLWESKAQAEQVYSETWRAFVRGKYGSEPCVTYLECPVVVDNASGEIISD
jgi:hypothetical protein